MPVKWGKKQSVQSLGKALADIDKAAENLTENLYLWGMIVNPLARDSHPARFYDTATAAQHAASIARKYGEKLGIKDPEPYARYREAGKWNDPTFQNGNKQVLLLDVTTFVSGAGQYDVSFIFDSGTVGLDIHSVSILKGTSAETAKIVDTALAGIPCGKV